MKEFLKWLGVNEKVAKLAVWIFIFMFFLIVVNAALDSFGLPYYKVTIDNLSKIDIPKLLEFLLSWFVVFLNFLSFTLLIFDIKNIKQISLFAIIYVMLNILAKYFLGYSGSQIVIIIFLFVFAYLYSNKNKKYLLYMFISIIINTIIEYVCYLYKMKFVDFSTLSWFNRFLMSIDYFLIASVIIMLKEIYLKKKRSD